MTSIAHGDRETLIAAWQALGSSQTLCDELQNLCLMHLSRMGRIVNAASSSNSTSNQPNTSDQRVFALPPPQRFTRRARISTSQPPAGPSTPFEPVILKRGGEELSFEVHVVVPDGPTDEQYPTFCERKYQASRETRKL
jgi:hypothetical protein